MDNKLKLSYLGTFWGASGTICWLSKPDRTQARIYVDSIGETWVDVRRVPEGGAFATERVECYRVLNGWTKAAIDLQAEGFAEMRMDEHAHRVRERGI